ncbi:MAG: ABC transporter substrate-binding protein [Candidatus Colwellbacteria bacterium]|nr:ABC transporter substrate-binding protein [Candidatus Colwellbacteria bacterium]
MFYKLFQLIRSLEKRELMVLWISAAVLVVTGTLFVVFTMTERTEDVPVTGGTWREGSIGQPVFINPVISGNDADQDISRLVFASLADMSDDIRSDETGREWTVRLKEGIRWHDGEKITSDDVIFTFDTIVNPESRSPIAGNFDGASVSRVSELEFKFSLPSSYVFFGNTLRNMRIIPKHIFGNIPPANFSLSSFIREPIGSGPYKFASYEKEKNGFVSEYRLTVNKDYFGDKPFIKEIIFKYYSDKNSLAEAYMNGEIDGFLASDPGLVSGITIRREIKTLHATRYYAAFLNPSIVSAFKDASVRRSLSNDVSRDRIVNEVFGGFAVPLLGPVSGSGVSGPSARLDGLSFTITVPDLEPLVKTADILKSDWESQGAMITVKALRPADIQQVIKDRSYEVLIFGNILNEPQDLYSFWHSSKRFYPGLNLSMWNDRTGDSLMEEIRTEVYPAVRAELASKLTSLIADSTSAVFLASPDYIYIVSPRLKGFETTEVITPVDRLADISKWYLVTERKVK